MTGPPDPDDLLPEQRGAVPPAEEIAKRERGGAGRWGRLRSWFTILVGLLALLVCYFVVRQTR